MKTRLIKVHPRRPAKKGMKLAAAIIRRGGVVAFPTETVYGLGAAIDKKSAIRRLFKSKGRPGDNPLIVHISSVKQLKALVAEVPAAAWKLMDRFWPGPLTLIFEKSDAVPLEITAGLRTVAIRMPDHPVARALIRIAATPIAAPSANRSGRPSSTDAQHVLEDLDGRIDAVLDGGPTTLGLESTVVDITSARPVVLRPGAVTVQELKRVLGKVDVYSTGYAITKASAKVKSPGLKYRHYSPNADLFLWEGSASRVRSHLSRHLNTVARRNKKVAIMTTDISYCVGGLQNVIVGSDAQEVGQNLYTVLRLLDRDGVDVILAVGFSERKVGLAVMNRLRKAADHYSVLG